MDIKLEVKEFTNRACHLCGMGTKESAKMLAMVSGDIGEEVISRVYCLWCCEDISLAAFGMEPITAGRRRELEESKERSLPDETA